MRPFSYGFVSDEVVQSVYSQCGCCLRGRRAKWDTGDQRRCFGDSGLYTVRKYHELRCSLSRSISGSKMRVLILFSMIGENPVISMLSARFARSQGADKSNTITAYNILFFYAFSIHLKNMPSRCTCTVSTKLRVEMQKLRYIMGRIGCIAHLSGP